MLPLVLTCAAVLFAVNGSGYLADEIPDRDSVDETLVFHGDALAFRRPAEVSSDEVYGAVDEYRRIVAEKLTDRDPRYWILLRRASARFRAAVSAEAAERGFDLVAERGSVRCRAGAAPDLTADVVRRITGEVAARPAVDGSGGERRP